MTTTLVDLLQALRPKRNPYFHTLGYTIHLPFKKAELSTGNHNFGSLIHEYCHLLQAKATTFGIYNFIGVTERFENLFRAVHKRPEIQVPLRDWSNSNTADERLKAFLVGETRYQEQRRAAEGTWAVALEPCAEYTIHAGPADIGGLTLDRHYVARKIGDRMIGIPILGLTLCEAQAEVMASHVSQSVSPILSAIDSEIDPALYVYTTLPGLIRSRLPIWPLLETTYFLCDYALATFAPDEAFLGALQYLIELGSDVPETPTEWQKLWFDVEDELGLVEASRLELIKSTTVSLARFAERRERSVLYDMFAAEIELGLRCIERRQDEPLCFFPWNPKDIVDRGFSVVPASEIRYADGIGHIGAPNEAIRARQAMLTAAAYLFTVTDGGEVACPYAEHLDACPAPRTLACSQYPWGRGDVGGDRLCGFGALGKMLGLSESGLVRIGR